MTDESYNGWKNWDTWNMMLVLESDERANNNLMAWHKNFKRKIARGVFNQEKAESVVKKYLIPAARKFDPEIDAKKVDKAEIVKYILEIEE